MSTHRTLRLRPAGYAALTARTGWASARAAGAALGVSPTTITRALRGDLEPGARLIAPLVDAARPHRITFTDLFETTDTEA